MLFDVPNEELFELHEFINLLDSLFLMRNDDLEVYVLRKW